LTRYRLKVLGVDISPECGRYASATVKDATFLVGDIENVVGIPSNSADIVVFSGVLHHFDDFTATVKEAARVLKKGGRIFAYDPHKRNPAMWLYRDKKSPLHSTEGRTENERLLTRGEIRDTLKKAGYSDILVFSISGVSYRRVDGGGRYLLPLYNFFEELLGTMWIAKHWGSFLISSART
jgi:ubiquinone/menaquinone biosynthesis C-methylase UbiE